MRRTRLEKTLNKICYQLKITFAALFIIVGGDKFFNFIVPWRHYVHPTFFSSIPLTPSVFLGFFGAAQIVVGLLLLSRWMITGLYLALGILLLIFINLISIKTISMVLLHDFSMIILLAVLLCLAKLQRNLKP